MIEFSNITLNDFLAKYWQQKPILLKNAIDFNNLELSPEELAGMSLEGISSRIISGNYTDNNWQIFNDFDETIFTKLGSKDWTLLVQGVDRYHQKVYELIDNFNFIPRFLFDDVLISYATSGGSVGPHFDYYDVFLAQFSGKRRWQLSSKNCFDDNYNPNFALKIMDKFEVEEEYIVEQGDVLYIPPKYAHFGESLDDKCMTFSFGYRSYSYSEMANFIGKKTHKLGYLPTPILKNTPYGFCDDYLINSQDILTNTEFMSFVTKTESIDEEIYQQSLEFKFNENTNYRLHPCLKIAYNSKNQVFIAGDEFVYPKKLLPQMLDFCNTRTISGKNELAKYLFNSRYLVKC